MSRNAEQACIDAENARDEQRETARREWLESVAPRHTPGPWEIGVLDKNAQRIVRAEHIEICTCWHHCVTSIAVEMEANARLIAAAPELVEALKCASNVLSLLSDEVKALGCKAENVPAKVRAALAKAGVV